LKPPRSLDPDLNCIGVPILGIIVSDRFELTGRAVPPGVGTGNGAPVGFREWLP